MENGTYGGKPIEGVCGSVYESEGGAVMLALQFAVATADAPQMTFRTCLVNKDGALNTRNIDNLKEWSGWNGVDPYWFMENDLSGIEVELVIEHEQGFKDPSKMYPTIRWVNRPGRSSAAGLPKATDKGALLAKYGAKFRAMAGPQPTGKAPSSPAPSKPPTTPPAARNAPAAVKKAHTQETAWSLMQDKAAGIGTTQVEAYWFKFIDATGMDQADMTPDGWEQVEKAILAQAESEGGFLPF